MPHLSPKSIPADQLYWHIACDGSAQPNPGKMGLGAELRAPDGRVFRLSCTAPGHGCNNEAEIRALIAALQLARSEHAQQLRIQSDSSILIEQLAQATSAPLARLDALIEEARALSAEFESIQWVWVPRHRNAEADTLARAALGLKPKVATAAKTLRR